MMPHFDLSEVAQFLAQFADDRDWAQFHTPKNLAMALGGEAGELLEIFQWMTSEESHSLTNQQREHAGQELVDILQYVVRLADVLGLDLPQAFSAKFEENAARYQADIVRGSATKMPHSS